MVILASTIDFSVANFVDASASFDLTDAAL